MINSEYILINSKNETTPVLCLLEHPQNQYAIDFDVVQYKDDADFELNQQQVKFIPFDLTLAFKIQDYNLQLDFFDFIDFDKEMFLAKRVVSTGQIYLRKLIFKRVEQRPVSQVQLYEGEVTFTVLSPWFQDEVAKIVTTENVTGAYPLTYPWTYGALGQGSTVITNDYNMRVALQIEFLGEAENPTYELVNSSGEIEYSGKINYTSIATEKIVIVSNRYKVEKRNLSDDTYIDNLYQDQDFSEPYTTWVFLDTKGNYTFRIAHDGIGVLKCDIRYRKVRAIV